MNESPTGADAAVDPETAAAAQAAALVAARFRELHGADPEGVWSAPGRVNLIGEHTDYNAGLCLPIAIPQRTLVAARRRTDRRLTLASLQEPRGYDLGLDDVAAGAPQGWGAYAAGVPWALARRRHDVGGLDLVVDGRVPLGAGLSSSAALECAVAVACSDLFTLGLVEHDTGRAELASACRDAENVVAQAPTGGMDQSAALRCTPAHALLLDCRDGSTQQVPFDLPAHGLVLLVMDTRARHALVDGQYAARRQSCERAAHDLGVRSLREVPADSLDRALPRLDDDVTRRRARHVVTEIQRVRDTVTALRADDFAAVGVLFDESHASMRDDFEISCAELDLAVETARRHGALGSRMTGGGFGGSAIAVVPADRLAVVTEAVTEAFAHADFRAPQCFPVQAAGPARRDG
ncbi:galactokinase [Segeticoccus rhizosphaerae]|uniref:galactokinase n=1 Tax=Segeticoccus rhizosphaerae TaxID=1104777 RepID=UPI0010C0B770